MQGAQRGSNVGRRIPPRDESARDALLRAFRARLFSVIARRDLRGLTSCLSSSARARMEGGSGPEAFLQEWETAEGGLSRMWQELETVIRMGGVFETPARFAAPYFYALFPDDLDPFEYDVVVRAGALLRAEPDRRSPVVETLRWDILEIQSFVNDGPWRFVRSAGGKLGYVERSAIRSPAGLHAVFEKQDGAWRLSMFLSGE